MPRRDLLLLPLALTAGLLIGLLDTNPNWDDTGITAGLLLLASAAFGATASRLAWRWALAVGCWLPLLNLLRLHNPGAIVALVFAFVGAYLGALARWSFGHLRGAL